MSHKNTLREDKTCLNCNYVVDNRFCPNCGQENTDTRKTFHHLFIHFFEDLTHYENAFWKTIKNLLFKPAALTKEYLSGKRLSYLAPVRLYIFISFVTFFLMAVIPDNEKEDDNVKIKNGSKKEYYDPSNSEKLMKESDSLYHDSILNIKIKDEVQRIEELRKKGHVTNANADSLIKYIKIAKKDTLLNNKGNFFRSEYKSITEMDSIRKAAPDKISAIEYWFSKKTIPLNDKYSQDELNEKFIESFIRNFPKALFIYMPLFALVLWFFHNKKRWYYFDHGIFTLHYFSFLLLTSLIISIFNCLVDFLGSNYVITGLKILVGIVGYGWMFYYFFPAHHRFYGETRIISFIKSSIILFINIFLIALVLILFAIYAFINIH